MAIRNEFHETILGSPPTGWSLGHVTLTLTCPSERIPVEAWRRGAFAVHATIDGGARVTHAPTGLRIWSAPSLDIAAEMAEAIENLADWESIKAEMPSGSDLYPRVCEVCERLESLSCTD